MILVAVVYSVVDFMVRSDNEVMQLARTRLLQHMDFGYSSVMSWMYFAIVAAILAVVCGIISRVVYYYD
jgi:ABC-type sugar transport system permease subunit